MRTAVLGGKFGLERRKPSGRTAGKRLEEQNMPRGGSWREDQVKINELPPLGVS